MELQSEARWDVRSHLFSLMARLRLFVIKIVGLLHTM